MKILYLPIFEPGAYHDRQKANKCGLREALSRRGEVWEWDYCSHDRADVYHELCRKIIAFQPDLLLTQFHDTDRITPSQMAEIRRDYPSLKIANWNGDYWPEKLTSPEMLELLKSVDLQLVINGSVLPIYADHGIGAAYWQFGYEPELCSMDAPQHDVVFLANNYSEKRAELGNLIQSLPYNVGLYGSGWNSAAGECNYDFATGHAIYRNAKIAISDSQWPDAEGYISNRTFQAMAAVCFVLQQRVAKLEEYTGFIDGVHYVGFDDIAELPGLIEKWLKKGKDPHRRKIANAGQAFVEQNHTFDKRVNQLLDVLL